MKAIIIVGQENNCENYQLIMGNKSLSVNYDLKKEEYNKFLENISSKFAEDITNNNLSSEVGIYNGKKLSTEGFMEIDKIDTELFESMLTKKIIKLSAGKKLVIPATNVN
ncbi:hypothetical protein KAI04_02325 [Candidatus Pacearchaeota archaeon]|nr:hypothetical protein [Candidatus Pacearchaeota archaeon]